MRRPLVVACLQTCPKPTVEEAIKEAIPLAEKALEEGAQFLFLPEYSGGLKSDKGALTPPAFSEEKHMFLSTFKEFSRKNNVWLMIGSIAIKGQAGKIINRGFVIDDEGIVRSRYDKIHLFDIQISNSEIYRESSFVSPGNESVLVHTKYAIIGHSICYDIRFPHLFRDLSKAGAEILCVPAAFLRKTGQAHWHVLNRARAIENCAYVISACAVGPIPGGGESFGHSLIIGPWGEVIADGGADRGIIVANIDLDAVADIRSRIPSLTHDRLFTLKKGSKRSKKCL